MLHGIAKFGLQFSLFPPAPLSSSPSVGDAVGDAVGDTSSFEFTFGSMST